jgi:long-chain acyl-CoA synthetase
VLLADAILRRMTDHPERVAVVDSRARWTYGELVEQASRYLRLLETRPGDGPVAALLGNRAEYVALFLACICSRRTLIPVNHRLAPTEQLAILVDSGAEMIIADAKHAPPCGWLADASPHSPVVLVVEEIAKDPPTPFHCFDHTERSRVAAFYILGRQDAPLGAVITHANLTSTIGALEQTSPFTEDDVFLAVTPPWHVYTMVASVLLPLALGATTVLCPTMEPADMARLVTEERVTFVAGVPTLLRRLAEYQGPIGSDSLRFVVSGGDVFPTEARLMFEDRFGVPVIEGYGCTEACAAISTNPFGADRHPGTVGHPLPNQRVVLVDDRASPMPVGDVGEVLVRGTNVMSGYLGHSEETLEVLRDGWLHTGDLAWFDPDGFLHFVGRKKDVIIVDGLSVFPTLIEDVIRGLEGVRECAVIGIADVALGAVPKAVIVVEPGCALTREDVAAHCAKHLAEYKVPRGYAFVNDLPKTTAGRVSKATVRLIYGRSLE